MGALPRGRRPGSVGRGTGADYGHFPAFAFREEPAGSVARRVLAGLLGLLVPALAVGAAGLISLRRYRVAG